MQQGYDINYLYQEAQNRWLKPAEVYFILENHEIYGLTEEIKKEPTSGSLFLFDKTVLCSFRKDGHRWRKKKNGRSLAEAHEKLKVGNVKALLNCCYAHGETSPNFKRRSYWILKPLYDHIVLVHYRDISGERSSGGHISQPPPALSTTVNQSGRSTHHQELSGHGNFLGSCKTSSCLDSWDKQFDLFHENDEHEECFYEGFEFPAYAASGADTQHINNENYTLFCDQFQEVTHAPASTSAIAQNQKFTIHEISPEWGHAEETTKIIIVGSFRCDPSEHQWACMFGEIEVPLEIVQNGVIRCQAPPLLPGKVTLCLTSGNRKSCSELREFEYRARTTVSGPNQEATEEATKSTKELLLLVRLAQLLLADSTDKNVLIEDNRASEFMRKSKNGDDSWEDIIQCLLMGGGTPFGTIDWLLEELLKDRLHHWTCSRIKDGGDETCRLPRKEQGIIHIIAALGFEWALKPILGCGIGINLRDIRGLTALHWAASLGREKMVAALIASGASAGAVTDPSSVDPMGKTPASIAAISGHKGLAGYLSEVELTSHLSSLQIEETKLSKDFAELQAEMTVDSITKLSPSLDDDQDTLAGLRNSYRAAARIQSAFREHSFKKRRNGGLDVEVNGSMHENGIDSNDIQQLSAISKQAFRHSRHCISAALLIQKKYRGCKVHRDYTSLRQKAHVRGYQVRKQYKAICWVVGIIDKVVLRWRRKRAGLRGLWRDTECIDEEGKDEDILKVFRKQKVSGAIDGSISRVLSMVKTPDARRQYCRVLERYRVAKAQFEESNREGTSSLDYMFEMEDIDMIDLLKILPLP